MKNPFAMTLLAPGIIHFPQNSERELKGWPCGLLGGCMFSKLQLKVAVGNRRASWVSWQMGGNASSSFQSIRNRVFILVVLKHWKFLAHLISFFLWTPRVWAKPWTLFLLDRYAVDLPACLPSIMLKALAWVSELSASNTGSQRHPRG